MCVSLDNEPYSVPSVKCESVTHVRKAIASSDDVGFAESGTVENTSPRVYALSNRATTGEEADGLRFYGVRFYTRLFSFSRRCNTGREKWINGSLCRVPAKKEALMCREHEARGGEGVCVSGGREDVPRAFPACEGGRPIAFARPVPHALSPPHARRTHRTAHPG